MEQYSFLLGSSPDATILCINAYDDLDYIQRSIKYLESAIDSTGVGLVLTPVLRTLDYSNLGRGIEIISKEELIKHKEDFESKLKRKVFILNNEEDIKDLFNSCIEHFSS
jgi:hypothetical protein